MIPSQEDRKRWRQDDERIFAELRADGVARQVRVEHLHAIVSVRAHYRALADALDEALKQVAKQISTEQPSVTIHEALIDLIERRRQKEGL